MIYIAPLWKETHDRCSWPKNITLTEIGKDWTVVSWQVIIPGIWANHKNGWDTQLHEIRWSTARMIAFQLWIVLVILFYHQSICQYATSLVNIVLVNRKVRMQFNLTTCLCFYSAFSVLSGSTIFSILPVKFDVLY